MRLLYLSPVPWQSFAQRPHHFVRWWHARSGGEVLWVDPYPTRLPQTKDLYRLGQDQQLDLPVPRWLRVIQLNNLPVEPIAGVSRINRLLWWKMFSSVEKFAGPETLLCIGKPSRFARLCQEKLRFRVMYYDAMDDFPEFYRGVSRQFMAQCEKDIVAGVDRVLASSTYLFQKMSAWHPCVEKVGNACDTDIAYPYPPASKNSVPILGYLGTMGDWFDWDLIKQVAACCPAYRIELVGPVYSRPRGELPENIVISAPREQGSAQRYMAENFCVGLIPFKKTALTRAVDPIKYYEYRALGLPVLTAPFGEMVYHANDPGVYVFGKDRVTGALIDRVLAHSDSRAALARFCSLNTWSERFGSSSVLYH